MGAQQLRGSCVAGAGVADAERQARARHAVHVRQRCGLPVQGTRPRRRPLAEQRPQRPLRIAFETLEANIYDPKLNIPNPFCSFILNLMKRARYFIKQFRIADARFS